MSGADLLGLLVSIAVFGYLLYALLRGERFWWSRASSRSRSSARCWSR